MLFYCFALNVTLRQALKVETAKRVVAIGCHQLYDSHWCDNEQLNQFMTAIYS